MTTALPIYAAVVTALCLCLMVVLLATSGNSQPHITSCGGHGGFYQPAFDRGIYFWERDGTGPRVVFCKDGAVIPID
jgi:hypothetical protein